MIITIKPRPLPTIEEKLAEIEERYKLKFDAYQSLILTYILADGPDQESKIAVTQVDYQATSDQKDLEIIELFGGM